VSIEGAPTAPRQIAIAQPCTGDDEWRATAECLRTGWLTQGPKVAEFERAFAERHDVRHALATTSCTTALHLILAALGVGPEDEVIVPSFTWVATANAVLYCGARPVLVDIDPETFNIDPAQVKSALSARTRAIVAVHLFGLCADVAALEAVAPGLPIIEDAACAAGAGCRGRPAGSLGLAAAFSFHPRKSITTGEGGMVTTNDAELARVADCLRNHGASVSEEQRHRGPRPYLLPEFNLLGFNYRMTDLQGSVGLVQLRKLDTFIDERAQWAAYYREALQGLPWLRLPHVPDGYRHGWQSFVCMIDEALAPCSRNEIMQRLQQRGVSTRPGTHAVHDLGYYRERFGLNSDMFPHSRDAARFSMAIPLHNRMSADDYAYVVESIRALG
jgi:perosamine synthetase